MFFSLTQYFPLESFINIKELKLEESDLLFW